VIYQQIADGFLKPMGRAVERNLARFLESHPLTSRGIARVRDLFDFSVDGDLPQRKRVDLGQALSRVVAIEWNELLGDGGFDAGMVSGAIAQLREEIASLLGAYRFGHAVMVREVPAAAGGWVSSLE
jgi:hypothetical protein